MLFPERTSTLILRAEIISDDDASSLIPDTDSDKFVLDDSDPSNTSGKTEWTLNRKIRRKLLAKRPGRDDSMEQGCLFYSKPTCIQSRNQDKSKTSEVDGQSTRTDHLVILIPDVKSIDEIPYYHPELKRLAFRYSSSSPDSDDDTISSVANHTLGPPNPLDITSQAPSTAPPASKVYGQISIHLLPFSEQASTWKTNPKDIPIEQLLPNRLYRTCLHLSEIVNKHGKGKLVGYKKKGVHDVSPIERSSWKTLLCATVKLNVEQHLLTCLVEIDHHT